MKVLLVNHFPLEGSGSGTYTKNIATYLARRGNDVCVVFPENQTPVPVEGVELRPVMFDVPDGLPFNFPCFTTHPRSHTTFMDLSDEQLKEYINAFRGAIDEAIREFKPDIIHAQHIWILADLAAQASVPSIATVHGTDLMGYQKWPRFRSYANEAVELSRALIAISQSIYDDTIEAIPAAKSKLHLLLNCYNEDTFYLIEQNREELLARYGIPYHGEQIVLFAGKLTNFKGVDTLLKAAARYEAEDPNVITLLAGDGELREMLDELHKDLGLQRTYFLGHQSQDQLRELYNNADIFAMPSRKEAFGLVALEAMACGLAVVATNEGGLVEFVTEDKGTLVAVDDDVAFANAVLLELQNATKDADRRKRIAADICNGYSQAGFVERLEALYKEVIGD